PREHRSSNNQGKFQNLEFNQSTTHSGFHSPNTFDPLSSSINQGKSQKSDLELQSSNGGMITNMFKFISGNNKDDEIKVTFHVHLPANVEKVGKPVVLGDV